MEIENVKYEIGSDLLLVKVKECKHYIAIRLSGGTDLQGMVIGYWDEEKKEIYY